MAEAGSQFLGLGPFRDDLLIREVGEAAACLTKAMEGVPEARPAACLLGNPHSPSRRQQARLVLEALPEASRATILAQFKRLQRRGRR